MNPQAVPVETKVHITRTPGVCGGKPCIAGTRIRVQDVYVWHELNGQSPDEIVESFPHLTLADVHSALAYFWDNREEIQGEIEAARKLVTEMKSKHVSILPPSDRT